MSLEIVMPFMRVKKVADMDELEWAII